MTKYCERMGIPCRNVARYYGLSALDSHVLPHPERFQRFTKEVAKGRTTPPSNQY
ncbi:MAG: hypothetical protein ACFFD4_28810 [Candidatus Odinarchaeota archaeon]